MTKPTPSAARDRLRLELAPERSPDRSVDVHLTLPAPLYDKAFALARDQRVTVNAWIRDAVRQAAGRR